MKNVVHSEWVSGCVCVGLINGRGDDGPRENNHARKTSSVVDSSEAGGETGAAGGKNLKVMMS